LDYFITLGVSICKLEVRESIGRSDHRAIYCELLHAEPTKRKSRLIFSKRRAGDLLHLMLKGEEMEELMKLSPVKFFRNLSGRLSKYAIIYEPRPQSYFRVIEVVERELKSQQVDWGKVIRNIRSCRGIEYLALMQKLNQLRISYQMKEFHAIVGSLLQVRKQVLAVNEIERPNAPGEIVQEPGELNGLVTKKYRQLFGSDNERQPFTIDDIKPVSFEKVMSVAETVSSGKGLAADCLSDLILKTADIDLARNSTI